MQFRNKKDRKGPKTNKLPTDFKIGTPQSRRKQKSYQSMQKIQTHFLQRKRTFNIHKRSKT